MLVMGRRDVITLLTSLQQRQEELRRDNRRLSRELEETYKLLKELQDNIRNGKHRDQLDEMRRRKAEYKLRIVQLKVEIMPIRQQMRTNRCGPNGLRAINKRLSPQGLFLLKKE